MSVFMQPIFTQTVGSTPVSSITFNNIPQGFSDLVIEVSARTNQSALLDDNLLMQFNGSTTNYSTTYMGGNGSATPGSGRAWFSSLIAGRVNGSISTSNTFSNTSISIANYASANLKQCTSDSVAENNASATTYGLLCGANLWASTNPITSITFTAASSGSFVQYSTFTIYGVSEQYATQTPVAPTIGSVTDQAGFAAVAFTPTTPDQATLYAVTDSSSNTTYGGSSPIIAPLTLGSSTTFTAKAINNLGTASSATSGAVTSANSFASIATLNGTGSSALYFNNVPQNYTHLQIRILGRGGTSSATSNLYTNMNNGGFTYSNHQLYGNGSGAYFSYNTGLPYLFYGTMFPAASAAANIMGVCIIEILDYANTSKYKTYRILGGYDANGSGLVQLSSGTIYSYAPINSFYIDTEGSLTTTSQVALYGIA